MRFCICPQTPPRVLEAALKEIERSNGRIRSPLCFLRSRLMSVRTA